MMPVLATKMNCIGCNACYSVCPHNAIEMKADGMGFGYPEIDPCKCIECKLCEHVCPIINKLSDNDEFKQEYYATQMIDRSRLANSQSGGAFQAIAIKILEQGGLVYGAGFDDNLDVKHIRITEIGHLNNILGSKYVQSDISDSMIQAKADLKDGYVVLFSGTPCQIAGLKRFIPPSLQSNLLTVDLICHGVPSPAVYRQYRQYLEDKYGKKIVRFIFRDKNAFGWKTSKESVIYVDGEILHPNFHNFLYFQKNFITRPGCSICKFCTLTRQSDITVGDCWGWEKQSRIDLEEYLGVSLVLINNEKGKSYFKKAYDVLKTVNVNIRPHLLQPNLRCPTDRPKLADKVAQDFEKYGFEYIQDKYGYNKKNLRRYKIQYYLGAIRRRLKKLFKIWK